LSATLRIPFADTFLSATLRVPFADTFWPATLLVARLRRHLGVVSRLQNRRGLQHLLLHRAFLPLVSLSSQTASIFLTNVFLKLANSCWRTSMSASGWSFRCDLPLPMWNALSAFVTRTDFWQTTQVNSSFTLSKKSLALLGMMAKRKVSENTDVCC